MTTTMNARPRRDDHSVAESQQ